MLIQQILSLVNLLVRTFEKLIAWIVAVMESLCLIRSRRFIVNCVVELLGSMDRLLLIAKRYLEHVRNRLRFRLHYEAVTAAMRARYRELKRR